MSTFNEATDVKGPGHTRGILTNNKEINKATKISTTSRSTRVPVRNPPISLHRSPNIIIHTTTSYEPKHEKKKHQTVSSLSLSLHPPSHNNNNNNNNNSTTTTTPQRRPTPLALALQAQWTLLQQNIQLGHIPISAESDLMRVLESLPEHKNAIISDVESIFPYILAFAVAPIPSEKTQIIALGAMLASLGSIVEIWGRKAAAVLVHDFLTVEHNALHALEVTLVVALGDDNDNINNYNIDNSEDEGDEDYYKEEERCYHEGGGKGVKKKDREIIIKKMNVKKEDYNENDKIRRGKQQQQQYKRRQNNTPITEIRSAIIGGVLELILMMVTVSSPTAAAAITHPKLIHAIVRSLNEATPVQSCDIASILLTLSSIKDAAEVLVACKVYHCATLYIRNSVCKPTNNNKNNNNNLTSSDNSTITALCMFLRLVIRFVNCPAAFSVLQKDSNTPFMICELIHSEWGEVVEITCQWLSNILSQYSTQCDELVFDIISKTSSGERLASMLLWPSSSMLVYSASAALCWRWFALVNPIVIGSFMISNPNILFSFVQALATTTIPKLSSIIKNNYSLTFHSHITSEVNNGLSNENITTLRLLIDIACTLGISYSLSTREIRSVMQRMILHRLSPITQLEVQRRIVVIFSNTEDLYFEQFPIITLPHRVKNINSRSQSVGSLFERNITESASETDYDDNEDNNSTNNNKEKKIEKYRSIRTSLQWRKFILNSLTRLFHGDASGAALSASILQIQQMGIITAGASAVRRMPVSYNTNQRENINHHYSSTSNTNNNKYYNYYSKYYSTSSPSVGITVSPPLIQRNVVQRAEQMGGTFYLDSIRVILRLAHRYKHAFNSKNNTKKDNYSAITYRSSSTSSAHNNNNNNNLNISINSNRTRSNSLKGKAKNPWAPPERAESSRRWCVEDIQRSDALLFYISYENIVEDISEALEAVEEHTKSLNKCLQLCPTRAVQRRCLLNDLYMNVYPKIHMFLRFIQHHIARSRPVLQIIAEKERSVNSGNILELYEAIGHCVGDSVTLPGDTSIESH